MGDLGTSVVKPREITDQELSSTRETPFEKWHCTNGRRWFSGRCLRHEGGTVMYEIFNKEVPERSEAPWTSQVGLVVKKPPAVPSSGQEDSLEEGMATHSSILAWRIPWTEELGGLQFSVLHRVRHYWSYLAHTHYYVRTQQQGVWYEPGRGPTKRLCYCLDLGVFGL